MAWSRAHDCLPDIANRVAVLCFHNVVNHQPHPEVERDALHLNRFRNLLKILRRSFNVISLSELVTALRDELPSASPGDRHHLRRRIRHQPHGRRARAR